MKHDTRTTVCAVLARHFGVDPSEIELCQELRRDWALSDHELTQLTAHLAHCVGVPIRITDMALVTTVAQLIRLLEARKARNAFEQSQRAFASLPNRSLSRAPR